MNGVFGVHVEIMKYPVNQGVLNYTPGFLCIPNGQRNSRTSAWGPSAGGLPTELLPFKNNRQINTNLCLVWIDGLDANILQGYHVSKVKTSNS